jgi:hypothetical protein
MGGEYLVCHGCAGHLGRFRPADPFAFGRGAAVVVRSRRGLEVGEILCPSSPDDFPDPFVGDLLRAATDEDLAAANRHRELGRRLFEDGSRRSDEVGLPLALVDVEVFLDGRQAVLHAVRLGPFDDGPFLADLGDRHGLIIRLYDLAADLAAKDDEHGCASCGHGGGCREDGCGECGSGGCGSCSAGGAKELANYFAELREQMEQRRRVALL